MSRPLTDADLDQDMADVNSSSTTSPAAAAAAASGAAKKKNKKKKKKAGGIGSSANADEDAMEVSKTAEELEAEAWLAGLTEEEVLNKKLLEPSYLESLKQTFHSGQPFKYLQITDLLDPAFLRTLENELKGLDYFRKSNDLFEFAQSNDLKSIDTPLVSKLKTILYGKKFRDIMEGITGIALNPLESSVDLSANVYGDTNTLLCHDDELLGRRIAFILYLVPPTWSAKDGGTLDLYNTDADGQPAQIVKSLVPAWNTFTFFEVSPVSFHQVSEVLTAEEDPETGANRVRISISGWLHGAPIKRPPPFVEPPLNCTPLLTDTTFTLDEWLSPSYRKPKTIKDASNQFQQESSIELTSFLKKEKYDQLMQALSEVAANEWKEQGPANKRKFDRFTGATLMKSTASSSAAASSSTSSSASGSSAFLSSLHSFFQSQVFGAFLEQITGMTYLSASGCIRRFTAGCYTLAHSDDNERFEEAVDVTFTCLKPAPGKSKQPTWDAEDVGGTTHYIEEGVEEELMSLEPRENTLSIVYRTGIPAGPDREAARKMGTGGVMKFVKYINHHAKQPKYDFDYVFRVEADEEEDEDDDEEEEEEEVEQKQPAAAKGKKGGK